MDDITQRLVNCFQLVFPDMPLTLIPNATHEDMAAWDSIAAITLAHVIEDEFQIEVDLDALGDLDSFPVILDYIKTRVQIS